MTIAADIIQAGFREGNLIPAGKQATTPENVEALAVLNRYVGSIFGYEMGENLRDWPVPPNQITAPTPTTFPQSPLVGLGIDGNAGPSGADCFQWKRPPKNSRLVFGSVECTVWFPSNPMDGSRMALIQGSGAGDQGADGAVITLDGNGRFIEGQATLTFTAPVTKRAWLYRADLGQWIACVDLELTDEMPFPADLDDFFICALSMRLAPRYGKVTAAETAKTAIDTMKRLKARYRQAGTTTYGGENLGQTGQSYQVGAGPKW